MFESLLEPVESLGQGGEVEAQAVVFRFEPGRADAEYGPAAGQDVERGHLFGQESGIAVGHPGHHGTQTGPRGPGGQATEECVGLEHRFVDAADTRDLEEVVHHPHRIEADRLGRGDDRHHLFEQPSAIVVATASTVAIGEARNLEAEFRQRGHRRRRLSPGTGRTVVSPPPPLFGGAPNLRASPDLTVASGTPWRSRPSSRAGAPARREHGQTSRPSSPPGSAER